MADDSTNGSGPTEQPDDGDSRPIGQRLRAGRERVELSEAQVAQALNLDRSVVRALEAGDFDSLGAPIFVKGHLRNYARLVKLDPAAIVEAYEVLERSAPPELPAREQRGARMDERGGWGARVAWIVLALAVAAIGYWLYQTNQLTGLIQTARAPHAGGAVQPPVTRAAPATANAPARTRANPLVPLPLTHAATPQTRATAAPANATVARPGGAGLARSQSTGSAASVNITQGRAARTGAAAPSAPPAETISRPARAAAETPTTESRTMDKLEDGDTEGGLPIALRLTGDSWVEVDDADGKRIYYGLAHQGKTLYITGKPPLSLFLGDAPAVRVLTAGNAIDTEKYTRSDNTARFVIRKPDDKPAYADKTP